MATAALGGITNSTSLASSYVSSAFTPGSDDLLVVFVVAATTVATGSMTGTVVSTFTKVGSYVKKSSGDTIYCFVGDSLTTGTSQTVTFFCTGDAAQGASIVIIRVSGMSRTGASAIRQSQGQENQTASTTPAPVFDTTTLTGNVVLGCVGNESNTATVTQPSTWTEATDTGFNSPTTGTEVCYKSSGFVDTTVTWGSTSPTDFGSMIVELDTSVPETPNFWIECWPGVARGRATYRRM